MLYCIVLSYAMVYCIELCYGVLHSIELCHAVLDCILLYCIVFQLSVIVIPTNALTSVLVISQPAMRPVSVLMATL